MRVIVIGGGVIGLSIAYRLRRLGAEVTVLERARIGEGASSGNAGWVTPLLSIPLGAPGVVVQALPWMLKADSPLLIRPQLRPTFLRWLWRFVRASRPTPFREGLQALAELNSRTLELFEELRQEGVEFGWSETGILFCARTQRALGEYERTFAEQRAVGYKGGFERLGPGEAQEFEPALADGLAGALYAPAERYVRPETLTAGLARALRALGGELCEREEVYGLRHSNRGWRVLGSSGEREAERVVVACGAWSKGLLDPLGVSLLLEGAKGYSITGGTGGDGPARALYLIEKRVAVTPFEGQLRFAGTFELAGLATGMRSDRVDAVRRAAAEYLRTPELKPPEHEWAGFRPFAPDSLPYLGQAPGLEGLFVATGHGMLGVTLAPASAAVLAPLVLGEKPDAALLPFAVDRFA